MHIAEGFLPPFWAAFWYAASLPFLIWGGARLARIFREHPEQKLVLAVSGAFIFVLSSLKLPSVTGSSSHPTGTGMAGILYGVGISSFLATIVLIFQALLLAHGGITTLGADIFSMGITGPIFAYFSFKILRRLRTPLLPSVFVAAFLSDLLTYVVTSIQLALAYPAGGVFAVAGITQSAMLFLGIFAITQMPLAIAEGVIFVIFFDFLRKSRPKLLAHLGVITKREAAG